MARVVYSQRLFAVANATSVGPVGPIVPAGVVWVVRDIDAVYRSLSNGTVEILGQVPGQLLVFWQWISGTTPSPNFSWRGRQIFATGEQVGINVVAGNWDLAISGYQLTLP